MPKASLSEDTLLQMLVAAITALRARLASLRAVGAHVEALQAIDENLEEQFGLRAHLIRELGEQKMIELLTINDFLDVGQAYYAAELFYEEAAVHQARGDAQQAATAQTRALNLFLEVGFALEDEFLETDRRIDALFDALGGQTPEETLFALFDYYEQVGAFRRAEAAIDTLLQVTQNTAEIIAEKQAFYQRLLAESDADLQAGGIPRAQIVQLQQKPPQPSA